MVEHAAVEIELGQPGSGRAPQHFTLRHFHSADDYARCETLQRATWGEDFNEIASATMMMISQKVGGVAAGAFDRSGELWGLVFGISGLRQGKLAHWSHILAVDERVRSLGLGRHLKAYQRDYLLSIGIEHMYWTYDPLAARNAYLNLNRLGAEPVEYIRNLYGDGSSNALHQGIGTDRFIVEWKLAGEHVEGALAGGGSKASPMAQIVNVDSTGFPIESEFPLPSVAAVRIEVPADIQKLKTTHLERAKAWRRASRRAFQHYMKDGYRVKRLLRDGARCFYLLEKSAVEEP